MRRFRSSCMRIPLTLAGLLANVPGKWAVGEQATSLTRRHLLTPTRRQLLDAGRGLRPPWPTTPEFGRWRGWRCRR